MYSPNLLTGSNFTSSRVLCMEPKMDESRLQECVGIIVHVTPVVLAPVSQESNGILLISSLLEFKRKKSADFEKRAPISKESLMWRRYTKKYQICVYRKRRKNRKNE